MTFSVEWELSPAIPFVELSITRDNTSLRRRFELIIIGGFVYFSNDWTKFNQKTSYGCLAIKPFNSTRWSSFRKFSLNWKFYQKSHSPPGLPGPELPGLLARSTRVRARASSVPNPHWAKHKPELSFKSPEFGPYTSKTKTCVWLNKLRCVSSR